MILTFPSTNLLFNNIISQLSKRLLKAYHQFISHKPCYLQVFLYLVIKFCTKITPLLPMC